MRTNQSIQSQQERLLERLKQGPCSTFEIRHELDIVAPAPRVFELRHEHGYNIKTFWVVGENPGGSNHTIAKYVLLPGKWKGENHD